MFETIKRWFNNLTSDNVSSSKKSQNTVKNNAKPNCIFNTQNCNAKQNTVQDFGKMPNFKSPKEFLTSSSGKEFIKSHEGYRNKAYICPAKVKTIGYGHRIWDDDEIAVKSGKKTYVKKGKNIKVGDTITKKEAEKLLNKDIKAAESAVKKFVKVEINQNQFDALVSFAFNIGRTAFRRSNAVNLLNQGKYYEAAEAIEKYSKSENRSPEEKLRAMNEPVKRTKTLPGLVKRRAEEKRLFNANI